MIDTHAHIYTEKYADNREAIIERAFEHGVQKILMPNIDLSSIEGMLSLEKDYPTQCFAMMGLHPCYVKEDYLEQLATISSHFEKRSFIAVGEIGLDFYWDKSFEQQQYDAFEQQLELARKYKLPVAIHMRDSIDQTLEVLGDYKDITGVLHCFSGNLIQAKKALDYGFLLGIGGVVTFKKSTLPEVIKEIPLSSILLETDSPYLAPTPKRGKVNEPAFLPFIAEKIAEIKQEEVSTVIKETSQNAINLFRLP